jgi:YgiT-type zinc finger domain-containing protein
MTLVCDLCGKDGARIRRLTRTVGKGATAFLIEDVPVISCPHCGETYLTAETLHEIERIKLHRLQFVHERMIPVARFGGAA